MMEEHAEDRKNWRKRIGEDKDQLGYKWPWPYMNWLVLILSESRGLNICCYYTNVSQGIRNPVENI